MFLSIVREILSPSPPPIDVSTVEPSHVQFAFTKVSGNVPQDISNHVLSNVLGDVRSTWCFRRVWYAWRLSEPEFAKAALHPWDSLPWTDLPGVLGPCYRQARRTKHGKCKGKASQCSHFIVSIWLMCLELWYCIMNRSSCWILIIVKLGRRWVSIIWCHRGMQEEPSARQLCRLHRFLFIHYHIGSHVSGLLNSRFVFSGFASTFCTVSRLVGGSSCVWASGANSRRGS